MANILTQSIGRIRLTKTKAVIALALICWEGFSQAFAQPRIATQPKDRANVTSQVFASGDPLAARQWVPSGTPTNHFWRALASSADGTKLAAADDIRGLIYTSTNSGSAWSAAELPGYPWKSIASSVDGTRLFAASGADPIYTSTNSGASWSLMPLPANRWSSVACSSDGSKLLAAGSGLIRSSDSGVNWIQAELPSGYNWTSVSSSFDGTRLVAAAHDNNFRITPGAIYASADSGVTWKKTSAPETFWTDVISSGDGATLAAVAASPNAPISWIYISTSAGAEWNLSGLPVNNQGISVACSADGTKLIAAAYMDGAGNPGGIYTSRDSGKSWIRNDLLGQPWQAVASSSDGSKLVAAAENGFIYTSSNAGADWTITHAPNAPAPNSTVTRFTWSSVAVAADGKKLVGAISSSSTFGYASLTYTSTDGGASWTTPSGGPLNCYLFASSADGATLLAALYGGLSISRDSGTTWTRTDPAGFGWSLLTSSADGTKLFAVGDGVLFLSTNFGANWTVSSNAPSIRLLAASGDGTKLLGAGIGEVVNFNFCSPEAPLYISKDAGATWSETSAPKTNWIGLASSADGTRLFASSSSISSRFFLCDPHIYIPGSVWGSSNSGATWIQLTNAPDGGPIVSSADATRLAVVTPGAPVGDFSYGPSLIYTSGDSGATWIQIDSPAGFGGGLLSSADGAKLFALDQSGILYTSQDNLAPSLKIARSDGGPIISWTIPSMELVLQQNFDLNSTNWTDLATPPAMVITRLQNQVVVRENPSNRFYRLRSR